MGNLFDQHLSSHGFPVGAGKMYHEPGKEACWATEYLKQAAKLPLSASKAVASNVMAKFPQMAPKPAVPAANLANSTAPAFTSAASLPKPTGVQAPWTKHINPWTGALVGAGLGLLTKGNLQGAIGGGVAGAGLGFAGQHAVNKGWISPDMFNNWIQPQPQEQKAAANG